MPYIFVLFSKIYLPNQYILLYLLINLSYAICIQLLVFYTNIIKNNLIFSCAECNILPLNRFFLLKTSLLIYYILCGLLTNTSFNVKKFHKTFMHLINNRDVNILVYIIAIFELCNLYISKDSYFIFGFKGLFIFITFSAIQSNLNNFLMNIVFELKDIVCILIHVISKHLPINIFIGGHSFNVKFIHFLRNLLPFLYSNESHIHFILYYNV